MPRGDLTGTLSLRVEPGLLARLDAAAQADQRDRGAYVRKLLRAALGPPDATVTREDAAPAPRPRAVATTVEPILPGRRRPLVDPADQTGITCPGCFYDKADCELTEPGCHAPPPDDDFPLEEPPW